MIHQRHRPTVGQTTCDFKTALCTIVHRAVITVIPGVDGLNEGLETSYGDLYVMPECRQALTKQQSQLGEQTAQHNNVSPHTNTDKLQLLRLISSHEREL